jgi:general stress protein 26
MRKLDSNIISFFKRQGYVIVSTLDEDGSPHSSCKGIVDMKEEGLVYLLDLYKARTYKNIKRHPQLSITAVDEHSFKGYCLKGVAKLIKEEDLHDEHLQVWEDKITARISQRLVKNLKGEKGHKQHAEVLLPQPEYLIVMEVEKIIDLTPKNIKDNS